MKVVKLTKTLELALWVLPWDAPDTKPEVPTEWTAQWPVVLNSDFWGSGEAKQMIVTTFN